MKSQFMKAGIRHWQTRVASLSARLACALVVSLSHATLANAAVNDCRLGSYRLDDGSFVDIAADEPGSLRWRREDGSTGRLRAKDGGALIGTIGWTDHPDGIRVSFPDCARGKLSFNGKLGSRIAFDVRDVQFESQGAQLSGRLVMPPGNAVVPIVILVHGSEHDSALDRYALQRIFPAQGIGAFVYDKRGTGRSGGQYTQNYLLLAVDAINALHEARRLAGPRASRIGYQGGSQGGWVAPLAAAIEPVDFVVVSFGLAVSPLEEDRAAIVLDMQRNGFGADTIKKALEVADATAAVILSNFRDGYDQLDAVRKRYANEPWFQYVHGNVSFLVLAKSPQELREIGPPLLNGAPLTYDPMPVLRNLRSPQLWVLGGQDTDAPSAETLQRLNALAANGSPVITALFPNAEHGMTEFEVQPDGTRVSTRYASGYFSLMRDFILRRCVDASYGSGVVTRSSKDGARCN